MIKDADTRNHLDIMTTGLNGSDVLTSITAVCSAVCSATSTSVSF